MKLANAAQERISEKNAEVGENRKERALIASEIEDIWSRILMLTGASTSVLLCFKHALQTVTDRV